MNKQIPAANKIVEFYNFKRFMQLHESNIRNAKTTLTTRLTNETKPTIVLNRTAKQPYGNSFSRMIDIELQNKALLKKLTQKKLTKSNNPTPQSHILHPWQQTTLAKLPPNGRKKYYEEHQRRLQNQGLLKRINQVKPMYQMKKYVSERKMTEKYINSISKFGYKDYKPNKTILKLDANNCRDQPIETGLVLSRRKRHWIDQARNINQNQKQNYIDANHADFYQISDLLGKKNQDFTQNHKKSRKRFTERQTNIQGLALKNNQKISSRDQLENSSTIMRTSNLSYSNKNLTNLSQSFYHFIPQHEIKFNGKTFRINGKQSMTKVKLEILEENKNKSIGNEYIHQVEISSQVYMKKFQGKIDVLIDRLRFDKDTQGFYLA